MAYTNYPTSKNPLLVIILMDVSASMNKQASETETRLQIAQHLMYDLIISLIKNCVTGNGGLRNFYRVAVITYDREIRFPFGGIQSIAETARQPKLEFQARYVGNMANALTAVQELLARELPVLAEGPAPYLVHITDGGWVGEDPVPVAQKLQLMGVPDGKLVIVNLVPDPRLLFLPSEGLQAWKGVLPETPLPPSSEVLPALSSPMPESVWARFQLDFPQIDRRALMLFPPLHGKIISNLFPPYQSKITSPGA